MGAYVDYPGTAGRYAFGGPGAAVTGDLRIDAWVEPEATFDAFDVLEAVA